jgi:hypothetical protein
MLKFLKGVVGSGGGIKDLPYNIGEPYSTAWGGWTHCRGTSKVCLSCCNSGWVLLLAFELMRLCVCVLFFGGGGVGFQLLMSSVPGLPLRVSMMQTDPD